VTVLTDDELASIREAIDFPTVGSDAPRRDVRDFQLLREKGDVDTGPAAAAIDARSPEIAEMMETVLSTRTHRRWVVSPGAARGSNLLELEEFVPSPVACVWGAATGETAAFVLLDTVGCQHLVSSLMGLSSTETTTTNEKLGLLDKKVTARLFKSFGKAVAEVGVRLGDEVRVDTDWRHLTVELGKSDLVVLPLEIEEPILCKMDIVIVAAAAGARARGEGSEMPTFADHLPDIEVDITAELGACELTLAELLALKAGAILPLNTADNAPLDVLLQGVARYRAKIHVVGGRLCLRLVT
jgi:flagellar motor switch/type III secretory pathway protein FliN